MSKRLPKGIKVLRASRNYSEAYTVRTLKECCPAHGYHCEHEAECQERYDEKCGEWPTYKSLIVRLNPEITDIQRYSDWIPQLAIRKVTANARAD